MIDVYLMGLSREEASVVDMTDAQLKNFQQRYKLFPEKREGTGRTVTYNFRDVMKLAAFRQMMDDGFSAPEAARAFSPYTVLGALHENGKFVLSRNHDGRWVGVDGDGLPSKYELRLWVLFDKVWPKYEEVVLEADWKMPISERRRGLDEYFDFLCKRRIEQRG
jgi:hypothetical protein